MSFTGPILNPAALEPFVESCIQDEVLLIAVVGDGCELVEDLIDDIIVGDGHDEGRFICTTSHPEEPVEDVIEFASRFGELTAQEVKVVRL